MLRTLTQMAESMKKIFLAVIAVMIMTSGCADLQELKSEVIQARKSGQVGWMVMGLW